MWTGLKGKASEDYALNYLLKLGYIVLEHNFFAREGELDLVARDGEELVFVEVKSVLKSTRVSIYETLTPRKLHRIERAINFWLLKNKELERPWRFDFIGLVLNDDLTVSEVEHIKNVEI